MKEIFIYKITNPKGCIYIGKTQHVKNRIRQYIKHASKITQPKLQYSLLKYGWDNHLFEIIETCMDTEANDREKYWISHFKSFHRENPNGLNLTIGGDGGTGNKGVFKPKYKVEQRDSITGDLIRLWDGGVMQIQRELKLTNQSIYACIKGSQSTAFGYVWCYEGEFNGIRIVKFKDNDYLKLMSEITINRYKSGWKHPSIGLVGSKNARSKPVYCIELDLNFESILLASKYFRENIFKDKTVENISAYISNSVRKKSKSPKFNFNYT
jgi:predicted GIY-YIG superfamily endonuclease